jgi:carboxyl-terminal processing protease
MRNRPGVLRTAALVLAAFAGGAVSSHLAHATTEAQSPYALFDQLARVLALTENQYVDPTSRAKLVEGAIKGMVAELDPHSGYMTPAEFAIFQSDTEGHFGGIGVEVDLKNDVVTVLAPMEGSPADRAGIRPGDQIVAVDGRPIRGERLDKILTVMRGPKGSRVRVTVRRPGVADVLFFDLVREEIRVKSVDAKRLDRDVGYVRIKQFQAGTHDELLHAAAALREPGKPPLAGVLLDLRNDPGGLVDEAEAVADELLDGGVIDSTRHRGQIVDEVRAHAGGAFTTMPVVALVNEYSASAAELLAGALQDNHRATLVGATTFGKGLVQTIYDLPGGAGMRLTTMRYYTPSGRSIQAEGIKPDVVVEPPPPGAADAPIVRERDLEGHLPNEAASPRARGASIVIAGAAPASGQTPIVPGRDVPADPSKGNDPTLAVAWDLLLQSIAGARR